MCGWGEVGRSGYWGEEGEGEVGGGEGEWRGCARGEYSQAKNSTRRSIMLGFDSRAYLITYFWWKFHWSVLIWLTKEGNSCPPRYRESKNYRGVNLDPNPFDGSGSELFPQIRIWNLAGLTLKIRLTQSNCCNTLCCEMNFCLLSKQFWSESIWKVGSGTKSLGHSHKCETKTFKHDVINHNQICIVPFGTLILITVF